MFWSGVLLPCKAEVMTVCVRQLVLIGEMGVGRGWCALNELGGGAGGCGLCSPSCRRCDNGLDASTCHSCSWGQNVDIEMGGTG